MRGGIKLKTGVTAGFALFRDVKWELAGRNGEVVHQRTSRGPRERRDDPRAECAGSRTVSGYGRDM